MQEALTNVVKHSGADRCHVVLEYGSGSLLVEITDPGPGVPSEVGAPARAGVPVGAAAAARLPVRVGSPERAGHGIIGMRERACAAATCMRCPGRTADSWYGPGCRFPRGGHDPARAGRRRPGLVRAGFRGIVAATPGFSVVGEAGTGCEAVEQARRHRPDVVLMDVRMPVMDGIEATRQITRSAATSVVRVLILTTFDLDEYVFAALRAGASGFLLKSISPGELLNAIQVIAAGDALLAPSVTRRLVEEFARTPPLTPAVPAGGAPST